MLDVGLVDVPGEGGGDVELAVEEVDEGEEAGALVCRRSARGRGAVGSEGEGCQEEEALGSTSLRFVRTALVFSELLRVSRMDA